MSETPDPNLEAELAEASLDSALTTEAEHESERDAHQRQGRIEEETRQHGLDDG
jgi:hypothetical protein